MVFYRSFYEAIKELTPEEQVKAYTAVMEYALNGENACESNTAKMVLTFVKPQIDKNNQRYKNGNKGGRTKQEPNKNQNETKQEPKRQNQEPNDNVNVNDNVNDNDNVNNPLYPPKRGRQVENLTVKTARGAGKPVDHSTTLDEGFSEFWKAYPKKSGKGAAETAWRKIKPNRELRKVMILAVEKAKRSAQWTKDNGQYIPNPATWLNQKRWEDELEPAGKETSYNIESFESSGVFDTWRGFE